MQQNHFTLNRGAVPPPEAPAGFRVRTLFYAALTLGAVLAVLSYSPADAASLSGGSAAPCSNWIGALGAGFAAALFHLVGLATYLAVVLIVLRCIRSALPERGRPWSALGGALMMIFAAALLLALSPAPFVSLTARLGIGRTGAPDLALPGGVIGQVLAAPAVPDCELPEGCLRQLIGAVGVMLLGWAMLTAGGVVLYIADWHAELRRRFLAIRDEGLPAANRIRRREEEERETWREPPPPPIAPDADAVEAEERGAESAESGGLSSLAARAARFFGRGTDEAAETLPPPRSDAAVPENASDAVEAELPVIPDASCAAEVPAVPTAPPPPAPAAPAEPPARRPGSTVKVRGNDVDATIAEAGERFSAGKRAEYILPPVSMLGKGCEIAGESPEAIEHAKLLLQRTLDSFNIAGTVVGHISGPRITQYEISLAEGVNVGKVKQIENNIKMSLSAESIRVQAPIPGRDVVGVEIPNTRSEAVFMRSVMESDAWQQGKAAIPVVLGKNVAGKPVVLDLAKAPHLLIAGTTGSGKSVCMNTLIMSLLFRFSPDDLRLIMVDPKIVEFADYSRLPHLITPVINDARKVPIALRWAVTEMENRYKLLARAGAKKIAEFNTLSRDGEPVRDGDGNPICDAQGNPVSRLPMLIVIIDELAELRMQDSWKDSETYIARIAQLGRAAGVHIVVATQRPSTNIITGVIKANLPTRIAFRVLQLVDSRVILDLPGAENLLGMGDMLYLAPGGAGVERVQGALVDDKDIKAIVKFVSDQRPQSFNESVIAEVDEEENGEEEESRGGRRRGGRGGEFLGQDDDDGRFDPELEDDPEFEKVDLDPIIRKYLQPGDDENMRRALEVIVHEHKASTSYLQRRLGIGYNQAAKITDLLEKRGIIGPASGSGNKREILIFDQLGIEEGK